MQRQDVRLIISDYEGVIARSNSQILLELSYEEICKYRDLPYEGYHRLFLSLLPASPALMLDFLLHSLGMMAVKPQIMARLANIHPCLGEFRYFLQECERNKVSFRAFTGVSLQDPALVPLRNLIPDTRIITDRKFSKLNVEHYRHLVTEQQMTPSQILYVDDNPMALVSAKQAGIKTVMMTSPLYSSEEVSYAKAYIDIEVDSFNMLGHLLWPDEDLDLAI